MLNSIKTLIRICKAPLNAFFNKKCFEDGKKFYIYDRLFFVTSRNFTTEHIQIVQSSMFFQFIVNISKILLFSRF